MRAASRVWPMAAVVILLAACHASSSVEALPEAPISPSLTVDPSAWLGEVTRSCALAASCAHNHDAPRFGQQQVHVLAHEYVRADCYRHGSFCVAPRREAWHAEVGRL